MNRMVCMAVLGGAVAFTAGCDAGESGEEIEAGAQQQAEEDLGVETPEVTSAATAGAVRLAVDTLEGAGAYITDAEGRALYLFTADSAGTSTCYDACAEAWPPLLAGEAEPTGGSGVRSGLIGTLERRGAGLQVTYGGHPLYYYTRDTGPGQATGQDVHGSGGEWYLVTPAGSKLEGESRSSEG